MREKTTKLKEKQDKEWNVKAAEIVGKSGYEKKMNKYKQAKGKSREKN